MDVMARIKATIESHPIVLFMKGTPQFPMCGFSSRAVQALNEAESRIPRRQRAAEDAELRANLRATPTGRPFPSSTSTAN